MKVNREELLNNLNAVRSGLSPREFIEQSSCATADTVIHTLGGDFTIGQLMAMGKTEFLVYSTDGEKLRIGKAHHLRKTKVNAQVFQVIFDTGHTIKLTGDHLVMLRNGTYCPVIDLVKGTSVMPFNHRFYGGYCWVYAGIDTGRIRAHVWVMEEMERKKIAKPGHTHHIDLNPWNNNPDNLKSLTDAEHCSLHSRLNPPMHKPGAAEKISKGMMGNTRALGKRWKQRKRGQGGTSEGLAKGWAGARREGVQSHLENHKVVAVVPAGREDVYDLSVDDYHNFAANGIFIHNCFCFVDGQVVTFNDEIACRKDIGLKISGAVQAASLLAILEKIDDPELDVVETDKGELEFIGKRKRFGVTKDAEIFLPIDRVELATKWKPLPKEFTEAVGLVQHCVSTDESRFLLCCIHLAPGHIEACDNLQILRVTLDTGLKESVLVRGTSLVHITSLGMDQIALTKSWIHFQNQEGLIFSLRKYSEDYPSLDKMIVVEGHEIVIPKGLKAASERAAIFASDKAGDPLVEVTIADGKIRVLGKGLSGWYREVKKVAYEGPPMDFVIAPELLQHISDKYSDAQITDTKLKVEGGGWEYVTVLGKKSSIEEKAEEEDEEPPKKKKKQLAKDEG